MSVTEQKLSAKLASDLITRPEFVAMCVSSWRYGAYATGDLIVQTFNALPSVADANERAYLGWEILGQVVELTEMAATAWLNRREPTRFPVHQATNQQIEALWKAVRRDGVPLDEIRTFLRLSGPRGFTATAQRTARVYMRVLERVNLALRDIATFWTEHAANVRWFRHYPATLTPDEAWTVDRGSDEQRRQITEQMAQVPDALEFITHMQDARVFEHTVLRMQDVAAGVQIGDAAIQLVMNWLANSGLDPSQPRHVRHLLPIFVRHLTPEERATLLLDGSYVFD